MHIFAIDSSSLISSPLVLRPGQLSSRQAHSTAVPVRFQPTGHGARSGTIKIFSDDPASPAIVAVSGTAPEPRLALTLANSGNFGHCCLGSFVDEPLLLANAGSCKLTVTSIASSDASFLAPEVHNFPLTIEAASAIGVPIRFAPNALGPASATLKVTKRRPGEPRHYYRHWPRPAGQACDHRFGCVWRCEMLPARAAPCRDLQCRRLHAARAPRRTAAAP